MKKELSQYSKNLDLPNLKKLLDNKNFSQDDLDEALLSSFSNANPDEERLPIINLLLSHGADINAYKGDIVNKMFYQNNLKNFESLFDLIEFPLLIQELPTLVGWGNFNFLDLALEKIEKKFHKEILDLNLDSLENFTDSQNDIYQHLKIIKFHLKLKKDIPNKKTNTESKSKI